MTNLGLLVQDAYGRLGNGANRESAKTTSSGGFKGRQQPNYCKPMRAILLSLQAISVAPNQPMLPIANLHEFTLSLIDCWFLFV